MIHQLANLRFFLVKRVTPNALKDFFRMKEICGRRRNKLRECCRSESKGYTQRLVRDQKQMVAVAAVRQYE